MSGGSVAIAVPRNKSSAGSWSEKVKDRATLSMGTNFPVLAGSLGETMVPDAVAYSEEFVTLPAVAKELPHLLPAAIREVHSRSEGFLGCFVLISDQEARLVTVITLWKKGGADQYYGNSRLMRRFLQRYVDRWLRSGRFAAIVTEPSAVRTSGDFSQSETEMMR